MSCLTKALKSHQVRSLRQAGEVSQSPPLFIGGGVSPVPALEGQEKELISGKVCSTDVALWVNLLGSLGMWSLFQLLLKSGPHSPGASPAATAQGWRGVSWSDPHLSSLRLKRSLSFQSGSLFHFHPLFVEYIYLFNTFYINPKARMLLASWRAHK